MQRALHPTTRTAYLEPGTLPGQLGCYVNSRYEDDVKAFRENYGNNHPRLVQLENKYDPMNLFRLNANVVPTA